MKSGDGFVAEAPADRHWQADVPIQTKWRGIVTFVEGPDGQNVDGYKLDEILRFGFFHVHAPVFEHLFVKSQILALCIFVGVLALFLVIMDGYELMTIDPALVSSSAEVFNYFSGLSAFIFGFFVFAQLGSFLSIKNDMVGGFWGAFQDLSSLTGAWLPGTDTKTKAIKETIVRWGLASFALMCGEANPEVPDAKTNVERAVQRSLLTKQEAAQVLEAGGNPAVPLIWMLDIYETSLHGKPGADFKVNKAEDKILLMRSGVGNTLTAVSSYGLLPLPLVHLMSALVKLVCLSRIPVFILFCMRKCPRSL